MSTEFRVGLDGGRNSSKVLKPPGGGSSDIFGLGGSTSEDSMVKVRDTTKNRIFGSVTDDKAGQACKSPVEAFQKKQVRRNPITGEGFAVEPVEGVEEKGNADSLISEKANEVPTVETPRVVQTSIRVRNPPGGKSSGIF